MNIGTILNEKFTVIGIKTITNHGKFYPNKSIQAEISVEGKKGAIYNGVVFANGVYKIERTAAAWHTEGLKTYDGVLGRYTN